jgi:transcriptional regulator with XRE-family HTH domain
MEAEPETVIFTMAAFICTEGHRFQPYSIIYSETADMTQIARNIKALRKHHQLTQDQFAQKLGIKRSSIGAYEEGRAEPPLSNLGNIAKTFDVSIDSLVYENIEKVIGINPLTGQKQEGNSRIGDVRLKVLAITVDSQDRENIEYIPQKAAAGYLNGFSDPDFLSEMPKFHLPNLPTGTYRAFEISGDSMLPVTSGSIIIGKYLDNPAEIRDGERYIVISKSEGIVFKRVFVDTNESMRLVSDNANFVPYEMPTEDVLEIWQSYAMITLNLPEPGYDSNLGKIEKSISGMAKDISSIKRKLGK